MAAETFARFVAFVAHWLREEKVTDPYPWVADIDPLRSAHLNIEEAVVLFTGHTREELMALTESRDVHELLRRLGLSASSLDPSESPVTQALRDLPPQLPKAFAEALHLLEARTRAGVNPHGWLQARSVVRDAMQAAIGPEEAGQLAARAVRDYLGLASELFSVPEVFDDLGVEVVDSKVISQSERMVTGAREDGAAVAILLSPQRTRTPWAKRFDAARALGHILLDDMRGRAVGAASSVFTSERRRRRSGAFAAELLLPTEALYEETQGALDEGAQPEVFRRIMRTFQVGARTAAHQLFNHNLLSSSSVRDDLIEQYAREKDGETS